MHPHPTHTVWVIPRLVYFVMYFFGTFYVSNRRNFKLFSVVNLYLCSRVVYFQIDSGLNYFNLNKLTVKGIFGEKDYQYRKMRITNEFFGVDLPRKSQIVKSDLVLAKKLSWSRFKLSKYNKSVELNFWPKIDTSNMSTNFSATYWLVFLDVLVNSMICQ